MGRDLQRIHRQNKKTGSIADLAGKAAAADINLTNNERPKQTKRVTNKRNAQKDAKINNLELFSSVADARHSTVSYTYVCEQGYNKADMALLNSYQEGTLK
ncbi:MAG: hypothetical protein WBD61_07745 [Desulfobulbales bacterium]